MNRIDRLLGILVLLQSRKYVQAETIADKFDISVRTVYRDIKALNEQGIPISFEQHRGYFVVQGYFLPPVSFTPDEANALVLMERMVNAFGDRSVGTHYTTALNKVKAVLRTQHKDSVEQLNENIMLQVPKSFNPDYEYLSPLQQAIAAKHIVEIAYRSSKDESTVRSIEPIGLVFYAFSWHVIGWCHSRKDYRDFKIARIVSLKDTMQPFTKNDHVPMSEHMKRLPVDY